MRILPAFIFFALFLLTVASCKKPYQPNTGTSNSDYLVVEGVVNSGSDSTLIKLSRTVTLDAVTTNNPETGARVIVESNKNDSYTLTETIAGTYVITNLNLPTDRNYRLHIFSSQNKEYLSDFVENKITPPIDSITYQAQKTGVQFYINSHDSNNKTRYYRWDYNETWSYRSPVPTQLIYKDGVVSFRSSDSLNINTCYKNATPSNSVFITTTDKLKNDVVSNAPLGYTDASTGKLTTVYSLLAKQYALTAEAYKYWQLLKTNTQQLGTIFDAQPSSSISNLHAVNNPAEPVIGYVSVSTVTTKRFFLEGRTLPPFAFPDPRLKDTANCKEGIIFLQPLNTLGDRLRQLLYTGDTLLTIADTDPLTHVVNQYRYDPAICVDCRLAGGTNIKPSYWPY